MFILFIGFNTTSISARTTNSNTNSSYDNTLTIDSIDSTTSFNKDKVSVLEKIQVDFMTEHHGIFRTLPQIYEYYYSGSKNISRLITHINSITDENGNNIQYSTSIDRQSIWNTKDLLTSAFFNELKIQIGNPNDLVYGKKTYILNYEISNLPSYNPQFEYNILGTGWSTNIVNFTGTVNFENIPQNIECFEGLTYSDASQKCTIVKQNSKSLTVSANNLGYNSGVQIRATNLYFDNSSSNSIFSPNSQLVIFFSIYWYLFIPPIAIMCLLLFWFFTQRAPKGTGVIVPQFGIPDNLKPAEIGTIYDDSVDKVDVSATIIDLAVKGYIKIKNISENPKVPQFQFQNIKAQDNTLRNYEVTLLNSLFNGASEVNVDDLSPEIMSQAYTRIQDQIYLSQIQNNFYKSKPQKHEAFTYTIIFTAVVCAPPFLFNLLSTFISVILVVLILILSFSFFYFRNYKTEKGILEKEKVLGLKLFIEYAKKDQLEMMQTPMQEIFEKYLPYAMVFNLHTSWSKAFESINLTSPTWYEDSYGLNMWNIIYFTSFMNIFSDSLNNVFTIPASETGSGFLSGVDGGGIGGGFSGGGGGGW